GYVILDTPIAKIDIVPRYGCVNDTIFFRDKTNKFSTKRPVYKWYILDEDTQTVLYTDTIANPKFQFNKTGAFFAKLVISDDNLCIDSIIDSIGVVISSPNIDFMIYDDTVCSGELVTLQQTTYPAFTKLKYQWEISHHDSSMAKITLIGDSVTFSPTISGFYDVKCIGVGPFCSDTIIKTQSIAVNKLKMNAFVDTASVCIPVTVQGKTWSIENIHLSNADTNLILNWSSDPATSTFSNNAGRSTNITFNQGGCYKVLVNAVNSNGCQAEVPNLFDACVGEIANFTIPKSTYCYNDSIQVSNLSNQNIGYKWFIKNNYPATFYPSDTSTNPIIICTDSGTYEVALIAYTSYGCPDTFSVDVSIKKPYSNFSSPDSISICGPTTVELKTQTVGGINFTWNFGDGSPDFTTNSRTTFHLFEIKNGKSKFDITLNVLDGSGCFYQVKKQKYIQLIGPSPFFTINKTRGCHETEITFADSNYGVAKYFFNDGRGNFDTILNNKYIYKAVDTTRDYTAYYPFMIGYDSSGQCSNLFFLKDSIRIYNKPKTVFDADLLMTCENQPISFSNNTLKNTKQYWSFLNPTIINDTSRNPIFSYNKPGRYPVQLVTQNKYGCFDTLFKFNYISIQPRPRAEFVTQDTLFCSFDTVIFSDRSIFKIPIRSFLWDFGDTLIANDTDVFRVSKYRYNQPGIYDIKLKITDSLGCVDSIYKPFLIHISDQKVADLARMHYATVLNDSQIEMSWSRNRSSFFEKYIIFRDSNGYISPIYQNYQRSDTSYIDRVDLNTVKRDFRYGVVAQEKCFKKTRPTRFHKYIYLEADTLSPAGLLLQWNRYQGWDSAWVPEIIKTTNLDSGFQTISDKKFRDSLYHDYPLCDSFYYYKIIAHHKLSPYFSESNLIMKKAYYRKSRFGNEIITTTTDENNVIIKWDTTNSSPFKHSFHIYKSEGNTSNFKDIRTIVNNNIYTDEIVDIYKTFYIYSIVREDYCGSLINPANYGNSIYLNARQNEDTAYLNWNSYRYWKKGVKNYYVQLYDLASQKFETIAKLGSADTTWKQDKLPNLIDPNFCYRVIAIGNDHAKNDTSISNKACVVIPAKVFVPTAFSPNGDGINDIFKPTTSFIYYNGDKPSLQYHMLIYDRWGEKLYETDNIFEGWDGNINGKPAISDTYFYKIIAFPYDGFEKINLKGQFFLLR
ncbi:MAG: gliding motility-associated C-terminal domain-containing protein, partial [Bacteroidetes bacterium]|nr:gliding motility-associated C-terminal domain-containing protein [Bacteroidota bacterium]